MSISNNNGSNEEENIETQETPEEQNETNEAEVLTSGWTEEPKQIDPTENFEIIQAQVEYEKLTIEAILERSEGVDVVEAAKELLRWLEANVEGYIDNKVKAFKLDLVIDSEDEDMQNLKLMQDLYRAIPDDKLTEDKLKEIEGTEELDRLVACRAHLNQITDDIFRVARNGSETRELRDELFKRLIYYYEIAGVTKEGIILEKQLTGNVDILQFEYEAFNVGVRIYKSNKQKEVEEFLRQNRERSIEAGEIQEELEEVMENTENETNEDGKELLNEYVIEEGFTVWIELAYKENSRPTSLF
jgi:hypothetical protein